MLSQKYNDFSHPNLDLEQYGTSPRVAANLVYRAYTLSDITGLHVIDLCSGPGILGIAALLLGAASCTFVEIDPVAIEDLKRNLELFSVTDLSTVVQADARTISNKYDTCLTNPPFGIQQRSVTDTMILQKALEISDIVYSIHDSSPSNLEFLPEFVKKSGGTPLEYYIDQLPLRRQFSFHSMTSKKKDVMILRSSGLSNTSGT